jgi:hypothetical protein
VSRCLPLLREYNRRGELVSLLIDAGDSAWARGAHEVRFYFWKISLGLMGRLHRWHISP